MIERKLNDWWITVETRVFDFKFDTPKITSLDVNADKNLISLSGLLHFSKKFETKTMATLGKLCHLY